MKHRTHLLTSMQDADRTSRSRRGNTPKERQKQDGLARKFDERFVCKIMGGLDGNRKKYEYAVYEGVVVRKPSDGNWADAEQYKSGEWVEIPWGEGTYDNPGGWWAMGKVISEEEAKNLMSNKD